MSMPVVCCAVPAMLRFCLRAAAATFVLAAAGCQSYDAGLIADQGRGAETRRSPVSEGDHAREDMPVAVRDASVGRAWTQELGDAAVDAFDPADASARDAGARDPGDRDVRVTPLCGNAVLDNGELCDVAIASGEPGACPTECGDQTGCMRDAPVGEACQVACAPIEIRTLMPGDGCCPAIEGANAITDTDCAAVCGNGVTEPGEQCDGDAGCDPDCTRPSASELSCRAARGDGACAACECRHCAEQVLDCVASGDEGDKGDAQCAAVLDCGHEHHCTAIDCYCGNASLVACAVSPHGPCVTQIQAAAGTSDATAVYEAQMDGDGPVGRAAALGSCAKSTCAAECGF
jgi:hypothetical protein